MKKISHNYFYIKIIFKNILMFAVEVNNILKLLLIIKILKIFDIFHEVTLNMYLWD